MGICESRCNSRGTETQLTNHTEFKDECSSKAQNAKLDLHRPSTTEGLTHLPTTPSFRVLLTTQTLKKGSKPGDRDDPSFRSFAEHHKKLGTKYYQAQDFQRAIDEYSIAVKYYPWEPVYYFDRALSYKMMKEWEKAIDDCKAALKLAPQHLKANHLISVCLFQMNQEKDNLNVLSECLQYIEIAYKQALKNKSTAELQFLQLERRKMKKVYHSLESKATETRIAGVHDYLKHLNQLQHPEDQEFIPDIHKEFKEMVEENKPELVQREIPDHLIAKISFELLKDPLLTMDGITYEANDLRQHFEKIGYFDPITRRELDYNRVIPNKTIVNCVDDFLDQNPWAYEEPAPVLSNDTDNVDHNNDY